VQAQIRGWTRLPTLTGAVLAGTLLAATAATAGCGMFPRTPPAPTTPTTTLPTTPTPTFDPRLGLETQVATAGLQPPDLGVTGVTSEEAIGTLAMPCDIPLVAEYVAGHSWTFSDGKPAVVSNSVFAYYPETGSRVVEQIRPSLRACTTWTWAGTFEMGVLGEVPVTRPSGVDNAVGYCHHGTVLTGTHKGDKVYLCEGVVSRVHLISQVRTVKLTLADARAELDKALPLAAAALTRAVTAP
jgi:hypothetical protein